MFTDFFSKLKWDYILFRVRNLAYLSCNLPIHPTSVFAGSSFPNTQTHIPRILSYTPIVHCPLLSFKSCIFPFVVVVLPLRLSFPCGWLVGYSLFNHNFYITERTTCSVPFQNFIISLSSTLVSLLSIYLLLFVGIVAYNASLPVQIVRHLFCFGLFYFRKRSQCFLLSIPWEIF